MKKYLLLILIIFPLLSFGQSTYYVATTGNDGNAGTIGSPWLTIGHGTATMAGGDTLYIRGGTYYTTAQISAPPSGTAGAYTYISNYQDEKVIVDGKNKTTASSGMTFNAMSYLYVKGIESRNNYQILTADHPYGFNISGVSNAIFDQCIAHNNGYRGFWIYLCDSIYFYNCDAYRNADSISVTPGNAGDGFITYDDESEHAITHYMYFYGCRSWENSDDGFDTGVEGTLIYDRCWAFSNGQDAFPAYPGNGMKIGLENRASATAKRRIVNCLFYDNGGNGLATNDNDRYVRKMEIYNNIFYKNGVGVTTSNTLGTDVEELVRVFKNNISYANTTANMQKGGNSTIEYCTWRLKASSPYWENNPAYSVSDADFVSVDSTGIRGARQTDGSLPVLTFLHLVEGSDLIGTGVGVGLVYDGDNLYHNDPPDLGAFGYDAEEPAPPELPEVTTTAITAYNAFMATLGGTITSDGGGTLTASGIVWDTDINPTLSDNVIQAYELTETDFSVILRNIGGGKTIHVRAFATNETGTSYGADVTLTTPANAALKNSAGKELKYGTKKLIYK